jgi:methylenetetrahydrofolate reductase (NADH)
MRSGVKSTSGLEQILSAGNLAVTAEIMPPKTPSPVLLEKKASILKGSIHAANLTDNQSAVVRMSSLVCSTIVKASGIEPIFQVTCRDRNRLAIQSDILGAAALGIKNVLCVTGDHQKFGNHPTARNVYDIDSIQLLTMLKNMRDDACFQNGQPIRNRKTGKIIAPELFIGAAANPFGHPRKFRPTRLLKKISAGADFIQTQPVFDMDLFREWLDRVRDMGLHERAYILAGISPVKTAGALTYMKNNVPGIYIPDQSIKRMEKAVNPSEEGFRMAWETIEQLKDLNGIHGFHIMAIGWEKIIPKLITATHLNEHVQPRLER